ncbi:MAG: hypothetical protein SGI88_05045 [Candidatus Hydrogenedentes bacterium]|nr:hypothetical protein [Candidatus Hydrogenedentota bacterium]
MGDVNVQLVREFFELNLFHVLTNWQHSARRPRSNEHAGQLFVYNPAVAPQRDLPFLLLPGDMHVIERAVVEVRAWHADRFYPSLIEANPVLYEFVSHDAFAAEVFQHHKYETILVVSELPATPELRSRSLELLQQTGVGHVMEFPLLLRDMLEHVDANTNYAMSDTLQTLRLLKRYKLVRNLQMEFTFTTEAPLSDAPPVLETSPLSVED